MADTRIVAEGLTFGECPRWHDGLLWFSDQHDGRVATLDPATGTVTTVVAVPGQPSGIGWLPDGRLLIVAMVPRQVLVFDDGELRQYADLSALASWHTNDMLVDGQGRAYVGDFGWSLELPGPAVPGHIALIQPDGSVGLATEEGFDFPNGMTLSPDGRTFTVGETLGPRLTAFTVADDGTLHDRRTVITYADAVPDGGCLDAEGGVWAASPLGSCVRVSATGEVTDRIAIHGEGAYACMLGGADRRTLFICTAPRYVVADIKARKEGRIEAVQVDVPGAGWP